MQSSKRRYQLQHSLRGCRIFAPRQPKGFASAGGSALEDEIRVSNRSMVYERAENLHVNSVRDGNPFFEIDSFGVTVSRLPLPPRPLCLPSAEFLAAAAIRGV